MMSFLPLMDPFDYVRPSRIIDHIIHGSDLDDEGILSPYISRRIRRMVSSPFCGHLSTKKYHKSDNLFRMHLDVQQFDPEEITVTTFGENIVTIEGKHDEKEDEHGYISRHFIRRYVLPKEYDIRKVVSNLSSDGVLTITAPKICKEKISREIPIVHTGRPSNIHFKVRVDSDDGNTITSLL